MRELGAVTRTSQTFWKKKEGETVPETRSSSSATCEEGGRVSSAKGGEGAGRLTFSKNSPVSSSSPGRSARMNALVAGRKLSCSGR